MGTCVHDMEAPVPKQIIDMLPDWYYNNTYPQDGALHWVSVNSDYKLTELSFFKVTTNKMSEYPDYAYILFDDICNIIGPSDEWPEGILKLFWSRNVKHWDHFMLCAFVAVNGLNPEVFFRMGWCYSNGEM